MIALYVNHRPVAPLNNKEISDSFAAIARFVEAQLAPCERGKGENGLLLLRYIFMFLIFGLSDRSMGSTEDPLTWSVLRNLLLTEGENISAKDLNSLLAGLTGAGMEQIPDTKCFSADDFAEGILGFEM